MKRGSEHGYGVGYLNRAGGQWEGGRQSLTTNTTQCPIWK